MDEAIAIAIKCGAEHLIFGENSRLSELPDARRLSSQSGSAESPGPILHVFQIARWCEGGDFGLDKQFWPAL